VFEEQIHSYLLQVTIYHRTTLDQTIFREVKLLPTPQTKPLMEPGESGLCSLIALQPAFLQKTEGLRRVQQEYGSLRDAVTVHGKARLSIKTICIKFHPQIM
jgi:hypothetical protein